MARLIILWLCCAASLGWARISANDPADASSYDIIDYLEAYDCALPTLRTLRPLSHADLRSALLLGKGHPPCQAPEWLLRERQMLLRPALQNDAYARAFLTHNDTIPLLGIESTVTPLFPQRAGRQTFNGPNLYLEFNANEEVGGDLGIAISATPGWMAGWDDYQNLNGRFYLQEGYLKVGYKQVEVTWGRTALRFGDTRHGSLLMSGSAKPINLWKLAVRPSELFGALPFTVDTWIADQGDTQFVSGARLWAVELALKPADWLDLGFMELYEYGGGGAPSIKTSDVLKMLYYSGDPSLDAKRNRSFAGLLDIWFPDHVAQLYGQYLFSGLGPVSEWLTSDVSVLGGVWFPKVDDEVDIRVEYVRTVPDAYRHPFWRQGLTYQGTPLGHPLGPDAEGAYLDVGVPEVGDFRPSLDLFYEARAKHPPSGLLTEWRYGGGLDARSRWGTLALDLGVRYAYVVNFSYLKNNQSVLAGMGTLRYSFL